MTPTDLDDRIRTLVHDIADTAPAPLPFTDLDDGQTARERPAERSRRRGPLVAAAAGLALILAITGVVALVRPGPSTRPTTPADGGLPTHELIEYSQSTQVRCADGTDAKLTGAFDRMTFETWADPAIHRYRMRVTYPDASTRDVIAVGNPWFPAQLFVRGTVSGRELTCADFRSLGAEPGQYAFWSLSPMAPIPDRGTGPPQVVQYFDEGVKQPGSHADSRGRVADLWKETIGDTTISANGASHQGRQTTEWYVDAGTGRVLERTWVNQVDGVGTFSSREVLIGADTGPATDDVFATAGYINVPQAPGPSATPTTVVSTTTTLAP